MDKPIDGSKKRRVNRSDLTGLRPQISGIDLHLASVLLKRLNVARQVEEWKSLEEQDQATQNIVQPDVEAKKLTEFSHIFESRGESPDFARNVLWATMAESCRVQIIKKQTRKPEEEELFEKDRPAWFEFLRGNLLRMTEAVAPTYDTEMYGSEAPFAMQSYMAYEGAALQKKVDTLKSLGIADNAVDLGCATGNCSLTLARNFKSVVGYDISPEMIKRARIKAAENGIENVSFANVDIEKSLNIANGSVSLVVMNLGTASDIPNLRTVLATIRRILCKDGRFLLSFYNSSALFYRWFIPWMTPLAAEINQAKHCLDVRSGKNIFQIYAKTYTTREVKNIIKSSGLILTDITSYPTMASILPNEFFAYDKAREAIEGIDRKLASDNEGAYIIATGKKA
jgi:ubiquinone/menaquinone biosynthesis C-methylase UbiE/chorismate mutase